MHSKKLLVVFGIILIGIGLFIFRGDFFMKDKPTVHVPYDEIIPTYTKTEVGASTEGRVIEAHTYGSGQNEIVFVGGIHGGYEWNTVLLAHRLMDYFDVNQAIIPSHVKVTIIPVLNPDGYFKITGTTTPFFDLTKIPNVAGTASGRFNARGVDLNRNFDCNWQATATWQNKTVSAGTAAFSEPETAAFRDWVKARMPKAVVFAHSASNGVFGAGCNTEMATTTRAILNAYSGASGYPAQDTFTGYVVNGDASDWLATIGVPSIGAELKSHETVEFEQNLAGLEAVIKLFTSGL